MLRIDYFISLVRANQQKLLIIKRIILPYFDAIGKALLNRQQVGAFRWRQVAKKFNSVSVELREKIEAWSERLISERARELKDKDHFSKEQSEEHFKRSFAFYLHLE